MKKIIGFFKVLFHIQKMFFEINEEIYTSNKDIKQNTKSILEYYKNFMYLEKFTLGLRNKPLYEIGQTVFFNLKDNPAEKQKEENKLQGKIIGIYTEPLFDYADAITVQVDYEYIYNVKRENQGVPYYYRVPESKIIM